MAEENKETSKNWYDRNYKLLLIAPFLLFLISIIIVINFNKVHGDIILKDVSLTGGTSITVFDDKAEIDNVKEALSKEHPDIRIRGISNIKTGKQHGFTIESRQEAGPLKDSLEKVLGYNLTDDNSSTEFSGSALSTGFYQQLQNAVIVAFLLMGLVVFIIFGASAKIKLISAMITAVSASILFRYTTFISYTAIFVFFISFILYLFKEISKGEKYGYLKLLGILIAGIILLQRYLLGIIVPGADTISDYLLVAPLIFILLALYLYNSIPSVAVILAAFSDIIMTLAVVEIMGVQVSAAGIVAFLMLIGYSVDTDILLTSRLLRNQEGSINERIFGAFKTGITMTITAIAAVGISLYIIYSFSETLKQIFGIIMIGLFFDIVNTWITNVSILKWYMEAKNIR